MSGIAPGSPVKIPKKKARNPEHRVHFHPTAFVVLIPTASEYHRAGLGELLWWNDEDYRQFKAGAMDEIRNFVKLYPTASCADVLKKYYEALLSSPDSDSDEQYPRSPNSVMEVSHLLAASPPVLDITADSKLLYGGGAEPQEPVCLPEGRSPRSSLVMHRIERADSTTLYRKRGYGLDLHQPSEDGDLPGVLLPRSSEDNSPLSPPLTPVKEEHIKRAKHSDDEDNEQEEDGEGEEGNEDKAAARSPSGLAGLVPLLANAAAMVLLSFVKGE